MLFWRGEGGVGFREKARWGGYVTCLCNPICLGGRKRKRQSDIANDPRPPGLTEGRAGCQQLVTLLGQSKVIVWPASTRTHTTSFNLLDAVRLFYFQLPSGQREKERLEVRGQELGSWGEGQRRSASTLTASRGSATSSNSLVHPGRTACPCPRIF